MNSSKVTCVIHTSELQILNVGFYHANLRRWDGFGTLVDEFVRTAQIHP